MKRPASEKATVYRFEFRRPIVYTAVSGSVAEIDVSATSSFPIGGNVVFTLTDIPIDKRLAWEDLYREIKLAGVRVQWVPPGSRNALTIPWTNAGTETNAILPAHQLQLYWLRTNQLAASMVAETASTLLQYGDMKKWTSVNRTKSTYLKALVKQLNPLVGGAATYSRFVAHPWISASTAAAGGGGGTGESPSAFGFTYAIDNQGSAGLRSNISGNIVATADPVGATVNHDGGTFVFTYYVTCRKSRPFVPVAP